MRIIVTALSDELKQLVQYVVDYEPSIEVIREEPNPDRLPEAVAESKPDWAESGSGRCGLDPARETPISEAPRKKVR